MLGNQNKKKTKESPQENRFLVNLNLYKMLLKLPVNMHSIMNEFHLQEKMSGRYEFHKDNMGKDIEYNEFLKET